MSETLEVERRNSVTIKKKSKFKGTKSDGEWEVVIKQYYDGDISVAKQIIKDYNDKDMQTEERQLPREEPTSFSGTL
jgi:hypothetical protein